MPTRKLPTPVIDARGWTTLLIVCGLLAGCGGRQPTVVGERDGAPTYKPDLSHVQDAVPRVEPKSRGGNPSSYVVFGQRYHVMDSSRGHVERGIASWYGTKFHGRKTSNGETYDMYAMTAAHKHLPLPTYARVTNLENGRSVVVRVNDRGPFHDNRVIDLSYAAAYKLGMLAKGTAPVEVRAIDPRNPQLASVEAPRPAAAGQTRVYLQAGAFSSEVNARRFQDRLSRQLEQPVRVTANGPGVYRVQIGPLPTAGELDAVAERLAGLGIRDSHVVID
jgi:rare lipoprotein A